MNIILQIFGLFTTPLEIIAFFLALINIILNIRQNHWAWLFAIFSSATYGLVFMQARLYGDMALQVMFIVISCWGWYQWRFATQKTSGLAISHLSLERVFFSGCAWLAGYVLLANFLKIWTNTDVPHYDGLLTAGSILGQILLSRKIIENWHVWIIIDTLYAGLYVYKGLYLTSILYAIFVTLAIWGLITWQKTLNNSIMTND